MVAKYSKVWQLLVRLKRADLALRETWRVLKRQSLPAQVPGAQAHHWRQHQILSYIIACLLGYLQVGA